jgi:hypothetical protein
VLFLNCQYFFIQQKEKEVIVKQALTCSEEIYFHSLQKDLSKIDKEFGEGGFTP